LSEPRLASGRTAFLDRDGTINESPPAGEYVSSPDEVRLIDGAAEAIRALGEHDVRVVVVTNQRGIALGRMSEADLRAVNERLEAELTRSGARLDAIVHCPHHEGACDCRKPGIGLFERAMSAWPPIDRAHAAVVGDSAIDVIAGGRIGARTYLVGEPSRRAREAEKARAAGAAPDEMGDSLPGLVDDGRLISWLRDGRT